MDMFFLILGLVGIVVGIVISYDGYYLFDSSMTFSGFLSLFMGIILVIVAICDIYLLKG